MDFELNGEKDWWEKEIWKHRGIEALIRVSYPVDDKGNRLDEERSLATDFHPTDPDSDEGLDHVMSKKDTYDIIAEEALRKSLLTSHAPDNARGP